MNETTFAAAFRNERVKFNNLNISPVGPAPRELTESFPGVQTLANKCYTDRFVYGGSYNSGWVNNSRRQEFRSKMYFYKRNNGLSLGAKATK